MFCVYLRICGRRGKKITGKKHTNTQIHTRCHPKKIVPACSFVYLFIGYRSKKITALRSRGLLPLHSGLREVWPSRMDPLTCHHLLELLDNCSNTQSIRSPISLSVGDTIARHDFVGKKKANLRWSSPYLLLAALSR